MRINVKYFSDAEAEVVLIEAGTDAERAMFTSFMTAYEESRGKLSSDVRQRSVPQLCLRSLDLFEARSLPASVTVRERSPLTLAERRTRLASLGAQVERQREERAEAFRECLRFGKEATIPPEVRAQTVGTGTSGGYLAPLTFVEQIRMMQKRYDALLDESVVTIIETARGTAATFPLCDNTSDIADAVAENTISTFTDIAVDQLLLAAATTWRTKWVKCSMELAQDSAIEQFLVKPFSAQLARAEAASLVTALIAGATLGASAGSSIATDDVYTLLGSVDDAYHASPRCAWACRFSTLLAIAKLKDTANQPIFSFRRNGNGDFELLGFPVRVCPSVAAVGVGAKPLFFGDLSYIVLRRVENSVSVRRLDERFATDGQVGFSGYERTSAGFAKPSGSDAPVKYVQMS